jgi:hypothetical protein
MPHAHDEPSILQLPNASHHALQLRRNSDQLDHRILPSPSHVPSTPPSGLIDLDGSKVRIPVHLQKGIPAAFCFSEVVLRVTTGFLGRDEGSFEVIPEDRLLGALEGGLDGGHDVFVRFRRLRL